MIFFSWSHLYVESKIVETEAMMWLFGYYPYGWPRSGKNTRSKLSPSWNEMQLFGLSPLLQIESGSEFICWNDALRCHKQWGLLSLTETKDEAKWGRMER